MSIRKYFIGSFYIKDLGKKLTLFRYGYGLGQDVDTIDHYNGMKYTVPYYNFSLKDDQGIDYMYVGYYTLNDENWLTNVYVEEWCRHLHIATMVLRFFITNFKIKKLFVYSDNEYAIKLYHNLGFKDQETVSNDGHTFIIMSR